jgi:hypothetical protein
MVNKKGWIRIVEASISILIILSVILLIAERRQSTAERDLSERITPLLEEIAKTSTLREFILRDSELSDTAEKAVMAHLAKKIRESSIGYALRICDYGKICGLENYPKDAAGEVYAQGWVISTALSGAGTGPKNLKIFIWVKK